MAQRIKYRELHFLRCEKNNVKKTAIFQQIDLPSKKHSLSHRSKYLTRFRFIILESCTIDHALSVIVGQNGTERIEGTNPR